jgi:choline dehydrogenase-like flavoprotein
MNVSGDVVVVSCGAANSVRLLLISANDKHPRGLANGSDQVGRNDMFHNSKAMVALAHEPNLTVFQKTVCMNDWSFGDGEFAYPMGNIQRTGKTDGAMMKGYAPLETFMMSGWSMDKIAEHAIDFWISSEDLPDPENQVAVGHQAGTCRFGTDPATSVLDGNCRAHEGDNLYVVDTSFMPSVGAVNPSLTAIANALRVGTHLIDHPSPLRRTSIPTTGNGTATRKGWVRASTSQSPSCRREPPGLRGRSALAADPPEAPFRTSPLPTIAPLGCGSIQETALQWAWP